MVSLSRSWYFLGPTRRFSKTHSFYDVKIGPEDFAVIKMADGTYQSFSARCPHMNAPMSRAKVVQNSKTEKFEFRCSFHHWKFSESGECTEIPDCAKDEIPAKARLRKFPVQERNGLLFLFWGENADFPLPFFPEINPDECLISSAQNIPFPGHWSVGPANAFDIAHFTSIHKRILESAPQVTTPTPQSMNIILKYKIKGQSLADRILKVFFAETATLNYTVFRGNYILAETKVGGFMNRMVIISTPVTDTTSEATLFVVTGKNTRLKNGLQAYFSKKFFSDEAKSLAGIFINPTTLGPRDETLKMYMLWLKQQLAPQQVITPLVTAAAPVSSLKNKNKTVMEMESL